MALIKWMVRPRTPLPIICMFFIRMPLQSLEILPCFHQVCLFSPCFQQTIIVWLYLHLPLLLVEAEMLSELLLDHVSLLQLPQQIDAYSPHSLEEIICKIVNKMSHIDYDVLNVLDCHLKWRLKKNLIKCSWSWNSFLLHLSTTHQIYMYINTWDHFKVYFPQDGFIFINGKWPFLWYNPDDWCWVNSRNYVLTWIKCKRKSTPVNSDTLLCLQSKVSNRRHAFKVKLMIFYNLSLGNTAQHYTSYPT